MDPAGGILEMLLRVAHPPERVPRYVVSFCTSDWCRERAVNDEGEAQIGWWLR